jgi:hypothetical protein
MSFMPKYKESEEMKKARKLQAEREAKLDAQKNVELRRLASAGKARRQNRDLLYSSDRANPILGIPYSPSAPSPIRNPMATTTRIT